MSDIFNALKKVGYDTGSIFKPWFMGLLFFKNVQNT